MAQSTYTIEDLFAQLGLDDSPQAISRFIQHHRGLPAGTSLADANFWTPNQSQFINEAIATDADWCEVVDELDSMLRYRP